MRIVQGDEIAFVEEGNRHRGGRFRSKQLLTGTPGTPANYSLSKVETFGDFVSPRHKHNFDQYRVQLDGAFEFGRDGNMPKGSVGYFPEGTPYGPQTSSEDSLTLVLQFGGASGNGYMAREELRAATAELQEFGTFKDGVYTRNDPGDGRKNHDGYEAVWEHRNKRKLVYPAPRYQAPILMNPENFAWVDSPSEKGVRTRLLGRFGERETDIGHLRFEPGAAHSATGARLFYVLSGEGTLGNHAWRPESAMEIARGERGEFRARTPSELLFIGMPTLQ